MRVFAAFALALALCAPAQATHLVTGNGFGFAVVTPESGAATKFYSHPHNFLRADPNNPLSEGIETPNFIKALGWGPARGASNVSYVDDSHARVSSFRRMWRGRPNDPRVQLRCCGRRGGGTVRPRSPYGKIGRALVLFAKGRALRRQETVNWRALPLALATALILTGCNRADHVLWHRWLGHFETLTYH